MNPLILPFVVAVHAVGTMIGTIMSMYAEIFYIEAAADDKIDHHERKYLRRIFRGMKFGLVLVILSGLALIVLEYLVPHVSSGIIVAPFWAMQTVTALLVGFGFLLSRRQVQWWLASGAILAGWWILLFIDLGRYNSFSYLSILVMYAVMTFVFAGVLWYARYLARQSARKEKSQVQ